MIDHIFAFDGAIKDLNTSGRSYHYQQ